MNSLKNAWLNEVANSKSTRRNYSDGIDRFLNWANVNLEDVAKEWDGIETYRQEKQFCKKWKRILKAFKNHLKTDGSEKEKELAEGTIEVYLVPVNSFFRWYEVPVRIKHKRFDVTYHNRDINKDEIESIITNVLKLRDKAYFSMLKDSGLRPCAIKQLQYIDMKKDWEAEVTPCKINVPKHKNKGKYKKHYTFIGIETVEHLRKYWDLRFGKGNNPNDTDLIFVQKENRPISTVSQNNIFCRVALKLGITEEREGKKKEITQYVLRKFFRNNVTNDREVGGVDAHFFMGHVLDKNDEHYFSAQDIEKFRMKYDKGYEYLKVSTVPDTYTEQVKYLKTQLEQTRKEMEKRVQEEVQKQIRGIISEELHKMVESDSQTKHLVEDFIHTQFNVKPQRVSYNVSVSENNSKTITVLGYWRNNKYVKLQHPATITTK